MVRKMASAIHRPSTLEVVCELCASENQEGDGISEGSGEDEACATRRTECSASTLHAVSDRHVPSPYS